MDNNRTVSGLEKTPLVSVVTLTYNRREQLGELLQALGEQSYQRFEIIVVDNASSDGTVEMIHREFPEVRLIKAPQNLANYSYGLGVDAARGEYILMMDDDGLPTRSDWIARVVACFEANPRLGAVACTVRMQDTGRLATDSPQFVPEDVVDSGYPCAAYNGTGVGLRAAALKEVGTLYPRHFFRTYIELHFCTRLLAAAWEVRLFPDIEVWHCRPSGSSNPPFSYYGLRNYYWYVWQFYPWPYILTETLHELGSRAKLTIQGQIPISRFLRATLDAFVGAKVAFAKRKPISRETLTYLRWVRRRGNSHGLVPAVIPFEPVVEER